MRELYELKEKLMKEMKNYGQKGELTASTLTMVDTLAHALKNIDKIIEKCEEEEGEYSGRPSYGEGSMRGSYGMDGYSRRYSGDGSYRRKRDSMGRYSRDGYSGHTDMMPELEELMRNAPDERTRQTVREIMNKMESM